MLFKKDIEKAFGVEPIRSQEMQNAITLWMQLEGSNGQVPPWVDKDTHTIRFSNTVARELAKLISQEVDVKIEKLWGDAVKATEMQRQLDKWFLSNYQENLERMIRLGGIMCKWNGEGLEYVPPGRFEVMEASSDGSITSAVFYSYKAVGKSSDRKKHYTKAEYHRFEDVQSEDGEIAIYHITNKAFVSDNLDEVGREIPLADSPWSDLLPEVIVNGLEKPLYCYIKNPFSNTINEESALGVSLFSECIEELRWLDIAMSTLGTETEQSKPIMFVDQSAFRFAENHGIKLPAFVQGMDMGVTPTNTISQWQPKLQVKDRIEGINFYLSIIAFKCGFEAGYFVFNGQTISVATATQVEATERRTINTVMSYRQLFDRPNQNGEGRVGYIHDIAYILDVMLSTREGAVLSDFGNYDIYMSASDLTVNKEEEKAFAYQLTQNGFMAKWRFLVLHMGMTEEEAKEMVQQAMEEQNQRDKLTGGLFAEE